MPMWRCPHCGTPQAQAARCWVCKRSSTSCGTCRHFRHSVVGSLGFCGLDARRAPLRGDELRGCWEEVAPASPATASSRPVAPVPDVRRSIQFVPVESVSERSRETAGDAAAPGGLWGRSEA